MFKDIQISNSVTCINNDGWSEVLTVGKAYIVYAKEKEEGEELVYILTPHGARCLDAVLFEPAPKRTVPDWATHFLVDAFGVVVFVNNITRHYANANNLSLLCAYDAHINLTLFSLSEGL